jgi:diguanylate cyclase (GGDEF)-like protein/PAS domain S-box-containing protein
MRSQAQYQAQAFVQTGNLSQLIEIQITESFDRLDRVLLEAKGEIERRLHGAGVTASDLDMLQARETFRLPELDALRMADAKGHFIDSSNLLSPSSPSIADRNFFKRLRDDTAAGLVFSEAQVSRASEKKVIVLARRLNRPNGEFAGIVSVSVTLAHLENTFEALDLGARGAVSLRDIDLHLVARYPAPAAEDLGTGQVSADLRKALKDHPDVGNYRATAAFDLVERASSYRRLSAYPFYVVVGLATDDFLATWRVEAAKTLAATIALVALSVLFCWQAYQAWKRREQDVLALARQEEKFRTLLESAPDALVIVDAQGLIATVNKQAESLFGYTRAELLGLPIELLVPEQRRPKHASQGREYIEQPHVRGMGNVKDLTAVRKDGQEFPVEISLSPLETEQGCMVTAAIRDVTERQRAYISLQESEERFRLLLEGVQDYAIYMLSAEGVVLNWNSAAERLNQWRAEEIVGQHFSLFYLPEEVAAGKPMQHLESAAQRGHYRTEEYRVRKDGSRFWASLAITAIFREDGSVRGFAKVTRDITERRRNEQQERARSKILDMIVAKCPLPDLLEQVIDGLEQQIPDTTCAVLLRDVLGTRFLVGAAPHVTQAWIQAFENTEIDEDNCFGTAIVTGKRVLIPDVAQAINGNACCINLHAQTALATIWLEPILASNGEVLGIMVVGHRRPASPGEFELVVLEHTAQLASIAIEHSRSDDALELASSVYAAIGEAIMLVDADNCIKAINPAFTRLTGYHPVEICGKSPSVLNSGHQNGAFYQSMWHSLEATGRWQGEICNRRKDGSLFTEWLMITTVFDAQGSVQRRIALFSDITDQKRAEEAVWRHANYDPLTRLPNRRLFHDRLELEIKKAERSSEKVALLFIDLDHFKKVNDLHGHDVGDALLVEAALRIQNCVRETDTVARLGGDEFTVILCGKHALQRVEEVATMIVDTLVAPFHIGPATLTISGSVGIAIYPDHAHETSSLIKQADRAMYTAKQAGRSCYRVFTST